MPFQIIKADILSVHCDAVINPTDEVFSGSGGLDGQLHRAAGVPLRRTCDSIGGLAIGEAAVTPSYLRNFPFIIHTVAPWWKYRDEEITLLRRCYRSCLRIAAEQGFERIAFPLIGSGTRGFPKDLVLQIAAEEITGYLNSHEDAEIILVISNRSEFQPPVHLLAELEQYLVQVQRQEREEHEKGASEDTLARERERRRREREWNTVQMASTASFPPIRPETEEEEAPETGLSQPFFSAEDYLTTVPSAMPYSHDSQIEQADSAPGIFAQDQTLVLDESFSQMVLRKIDEKGFRKDSDCYRRANIDRRLFSRIRSDVHYHPKKTTAVALAVALELPLDETKELLMKAGYSLSHSIMFDVIIEYCFLKQNYNIFEINELLFQYDQPLLGG